MNWLCTNFWLGLVFANFSCACLGWIRSFANFGCAWLHLIWNFSNFGCAYMDCLLPTLVVLVWAGCGALPSLLALDCLNLELCQAWLCLCGLHWNWIGLYFCISFLEKSGENLQVWIFPDMYLNLSDFSGLESTFKLQLYLLWFLGVCFKKVSEVLGILQKWNHSLEFFMSQF